MSGLATLAERRRTAVDIEDYCVGSVGGVSVTLVDFAENELALAFLTLAFRRHRRHDRLATLPRRLLRLLLHQFLLLFLLLLSVLFASAGVVPDWRICCATEKRYVSNSGGSSYGRTGGRPRPPPLAKI